jgi:hypothetical protein
MQILRATQTFQALLKEWYLTNHGVRVPFYTNEPFYSNESFAQVCTWCNEHFGKTWIQRSVPEPVANSIFVESLRKRVKTGDLDTLAPKDCYVDADRSLEDRITRQLATEIQREIDGEIFDSLGVPRPVYEKPTDYHFWFKNSDDAILFKLTWGGE